MSRLVKLIYDLKNAKAAILELGWIQGRQTSSDGVCLLGALNRTCGETYGNAQTVIANIIKPNTINDWNRQDGYIITNFNDNPNMTKEIVLDVIDNAITQLEAQL